jgi:cysteine-rich repeat protein
MRGALLLAAVGCIDSSVVVCGDGEAFCPAGTTCVPFEDEDDFACVPAGQACGNRIVEPFTVKDGFAVPGEGCDEGDDRSHDGCSSACNLETPTWVIESDLPGPRVGASLAFDLRRRRAVMFGGFQPPFTFSAETWEWDGRHWSPIAGVVPPGRNSHAAAYDSARQEMVVFGGDQITATVSNDTWIWDGVWQPRVSDVDPRARRGHAMVYDATRQRVVMFGGTTDPVFGEVNGETWEWDGQQWREIPIAGPAARTGHAMAFDPVRGRVVLFGGGAPGALQTDTWEYDGASWTEIPGVGPPGRETHTMTFDPVTRRVVLIGGKISVFDPTRFDDVWEWDGATWSQAPPFPFPITGHAATSTLENGLLVAVNNPTTPPTNPPTRVDTWTRDATRTWTQADPPSSSPTVRAHPAMALDQRRRTIVVHGGVDGINLTADTWAWDGRWVVAGAGGPAVQDGAMAYDPIRDEMILFGGGTSANTNGIDETWKWSPVDRTWTQLAPAMKPPRRHGHAMAYLPGSDHIVMFGGTPDATNDQFDDTWIWNGAEWTEHTGSPRPPSRSQPAMVTDPIRRTVLMTGGFNGRVGEPARVFNDLWEWNGSEWLEHVVSIRPPARVAGTLAWDAGRRRVVLFGGAASGAATLTPTATFADTWELDWVDDITPRWTPLAVSGPSARTDHAMTSAIDGAGVTIFGGRTAMGSLADVFTLRWSDTTAREACGPIDSDGDGRIGCEDSDCWYICTPACVPGETCLSIAAGCGVEASCTGFETCATCPADCGACPTMCGDLACSGEDAASCAGDCPR